MAANYRECDRVEARHNGYPIALKLQQRLNDGYSPYYTVSWRTTYRSGSNRRFYHAPSEGGCWAIPLQVAAGLLEQASQRGMLNPTYDDPYVRFDGGESVVRFSTQLPRNQREILCQEITGYPAEPDWGSDPVFVIVDEVGGGPWRKIMIASSNHKLCTFRSTTTNVAYKPAIISRYQSAWRLDNAMQDASTAIMREFLNVLRTII